MMGIVWPSCAGLWKSRRLLGLKCWAAAQGHLPLLLPATLSQQHRAMQGWFCHCQTVLERLPPLLLAIQLCHITADG